ncbi:DUF1579 domain-containing protein [Chitinophaga niabensis]|uniref:DUF1579 domain-containing protein n=1 Tax=Chitinophaga niabensis TaxID=536979 RepID=A0A1N6GS87_9BACT|nr:DUF1579 domain-containing protein [Chitinophaga niabensis]SIO10368.1 Protein of unknown function [Chitinophaga niabensis]
MKRTLLILITCFIAFSVNAQDEAAQKNWMEYATPGSVQKMIAMSDGEWNTDITFWMAPGAPPSKQSGKCVNKMILGGRFQESKHTGSFGGQPFEGIGTMGYDNLKKVFQSSWVDNMSTGIMYMEGKWDDATRSVTFTGKCTNPASGKEMNIREVYRIVDDNTHQMEMFQMENGTEYKSMEMKMTRK